MQKGYLIVNVYLDTKGIPVPNALVRVYAPEWDYDQTFITDNSGKTAIIELEAPDKEYSLKPQYKIKPYADYDITVTAPGLNKSVTKNIEILPGETSLKDVYLKKEPEDTELIDLPEHCLWEEKCMEELGEPKENEEVRSTRVLPHVIIPEFVLVKNGTPTSSAAVLVVPFIDYIKNVTSSEIFSTWHRQAIIANVHAIVSFTLNRIFTEWYPSRGHNFTITAVPSHDQKYTHGRAIFQSISDVVDEYFRTYIQLNGTNHPFFAQYNDGIQSNHSGRLSQWGSQNLATQGRNAIQILRHFYTPNLTLELAEEVVGLPSSFPGYSFGVGDCGAYVQAVQVRLNRIRNNFPAIPVISPADGQFNNSTRVSVETFQRVFNMPVTGRVDIATWLRITNIFVAVAGLASGVR